MHPYLFQYFNLIYQNLAWIWDHKQHLMKSTHFQIWVLISETINYFVFLWVNSINYSSITKKDFHYHQYFINVISYLWIIVFVGYCYLSILHSWLIHWYRQLFVSRSFLDLLNSSTYSIFLIETPLHCCFLMPQLLLCNYLWLGLCNVRTDYFLLDNIIRYIIVLYLDLYNEYFILKLAGWIFLHPT